jgi:hypothetical protein
MQFKMTSSLPAFKDRVSQDFHPLCFFQTKTILYRLFINRLQRFEYKVLLRRINDHGVQCYKYSTHRGSTMQLLNHWSRPLFVVMGLGKCIGRMNVKNNQAGIASQLSTNIPISRNWLKNVLWQKLSYSVECRYFVSKSPLPIGASDSKITI